MTYTSECGRVTDLGCEGTGELESRADLVGRDLARSDVVPLHAYRTPNDTMTATTIHYLCVGVHKRQAQVILLNDGAVVIEEVRVA